MKSNGMFPIPSKPLPRAMWCAFGTLLHERTLVVSCREDDIVVCSFDCSEARYEHLFHRRWFKPFCRYGSTKYVDGKVEIWISLPDFLYLVAGYLKHPILRLINAYVET